MSPSSAHTSSSGFVLVNPSLRLRPCSTITSLGVLTGAQLFSLNKEELKTVCPDDGARVFSQVTVQKAALEVSGTRTLHVWNVTAKLLFCKGFTSCSY